MHNAEKKSTAVEAIARCCKSVCGMLKRVAPAFFLLVFSPLVAEYLCGSMGMAQLSALPPLIFLYGGGALLIREVTRWAGRGYPTMLLLALSYGILEEGVWDQSLFNPHFNELHLLEYGFVPTIGLALPWTFYVLAIHVVWSVLVPVAIAESLSGRRAEPWLKIPGLFLSGVSYLLGGGIILYFSVHMQHFMATPVQIMASVAAAILCIFLAFRIPERHSSDGARSFSPFVVAGLGFVMTSLFVLVYGHGSKLFHWCVVAGAMVLLIVGALWWCMRAGQRKSWTSLHRTALAGGALLTYCWLGFLTEPVLHPGSTILPHAILVAVMLMVLGLAVRKSLKL